MVPMGAGAAAERRRASRSASMFPLQECSRQKRSGKDTNSWRLGALHGQDIGYFFSEMFCIREQKTRTQIKRLTV